MDSSLRKASAVRSLWEHAAAISRRARRPRSIGTCGGCERIRCVSVPPDARASPEAMLRLPAASLRLTQGFMLAKPPFRKRPHLCPEPRDFLPSVPARLRFPSELPPEQSALALPPAQLVPRGGSYL